MIRLSDAKPFHTYRICEIGEMPASLGFRLAELGFITGTEVTPLYTALLGGIRAYWIKGAVIAVRDRDAKEIYIGEA